MNKQVSVAAFLLAALSFFPASLAMYGGDAISYNFSSCSNLLVNITNAQLGEWNAYPNCTEETAGYFFCDCTEGWTLYLSPKPNSVGEFNVSVQDFYQGAPVSTTQSTVSVGSGGSFGSLGTTTTTITTTTTLPSAGQTQGCQESWTCGDWGQCVGGVQTRLCSDLNSCGTNISRPSESQTCVVQETLTPSPVSGLLTGMVAAYNEVRSAADGSPSYTLALLALIAAFIAVFMLFMKSRRHALKDMVETV